MKPIILTLLILDLILRVLIWQGGVNGECPEPRTVTYYEGSVKK